MAAPNALLKFQQFYERIVADNLELFCTDSVEEVEGAEEISKANPGGGAKNQPDCELMKRGQEEWRTVTVTNSNHWLHKVINFSCPKKAKDFCTHINKGHITLDHLNAFTSPPEPSKINLIDFEILCLFLCMFLCHPHRLSLTLPPPLSLPE